MRQLLQRLAICAVLSLLFMLAWVQPEASAEGTVITTSITEDTVFTKAGSPYYIQSMMEIGKNATLTIEPGAVLIGKQGSANGLTVYGKVKALGTAEEPIKIQDMYISAWTTWTKEASMQLEHTVVSNTNIDVQDLQLTVKDSEFTKVRINLSGTVATIDHSYLHNQSKIWFTSTGYKPGSLLMTGNTFVNDGSGYTDVELSRRDSSIAPITINENNFFGTTRIAVKLDGPSLGAVSDGTNNYWGTIDPTLVDRSIYDGRDLVYGDRLSYEPYAVKPFANGYPMGTLDAPKVDPISDKMANITGTTEAEASVTVSNDGAVIAEGLSNADGTFQIPIPVQSAGTELTIIVSDSLNRTSAETKMIVTDETAPEVPKVNPVTDQRTVVNGTAEANAEITVGLTGSTELTGTSDDAGNFSIPISKQTTGTVIEVTAADAAKNISEPALVTVEDATPPEQPVVTDELDDTLTQLSGTAEPGTTVEMLVDGKVISSAKVGLDGVFTLQWTSPLKAGAQVLVAAVDYNKNRSNELTLAVQDKTAPQLYLDFVFPPTTTNPTVKGTSEPGAVIQVLLNGEIIKKGEASDNGTFSITIPAQAKGTILEVQAIDPAGNMSSKTVEVLEIDTTPPSALEVDEINIFSKAVTGVTEPNITVKVITLDMTYTKKSDVNGHFSIDIPMQTLNNSVFIQAIDQSGNMSDMVIKAVTAPIGWYVDAQGSKYYFHPTTGKMTIDWLLLGGKRYYFETNGKLRTNSFRLISSKVYYFNKNGEMQTGWLTLNSKKYYFGIDGVRRTGFVQIGSKKYYFNSDGSMKIGWVTVSGKKYYFNSDGTMKTGWATLGGKKYYFNSDGTMKTSWLKLGSKKYYFTSDGTMKMGWLKLGSKKYYFNSDGTMKIGWLKLGTKRYYFNSSGIMQTGWEKIGGKRYYFNSSGVRVK